MAKQWYKVQDVKAWLNERGTRVRGPHQMTDRCLHWPVCARCGLMALRNEATRRELAKECVTYE